MAITTFWDVLPERARKAVRDTAATVMVQQGRFLMREHTRSAQVFVLLGGAAKVWVDRGGETVILDVLGPGDLVGEIEAVDGGVRAANVEAITPVEALSLPAERLRTALDSCPGSVWAVAAVLAERLRDANVVRTGHCPDDPVARLASRLLRLSARFGTPAHGDGTVVPVPICQQDLGRWAGMGRRKVAQILAGERLAGGVAVGRGVITIRSEAELRRLIDPPPVWPAPGRDAPR
ncbi:Crp/Fnr family transcriptional regulator [Spirillospora sp. NPDC127200]